jgi:hypothetical protein
MSIELIDYEFLSIPEHLDALAAYLSSAKQQDLGKVYEPLLGPLLHKSLPRCCGTL